MVTYTDEFVDFFKLWDLESNEHSPLWAQYRSTEAIRLVKELAVKKGLPSISAFIIAFDEAKASGAIKPIRAAKPVEKDFVLTREMYEQMPAAEIIRKFRSDPDFAAGVNQLIARGEI